MEDLIESGPAAKPTKARTGEFVAIFHTFKMTETLRDRVRTIAAAAERETAGLRIASERVLNGHTVAHRLREIVALVRRRQEAEVEQPV